MRRTERHIYSDISRGIRTKNILHQSKEHRARAPSHAAHPLLLSAGSRYPCDAGYMRSASGKSRCSHPLVSSRYRAAITEGWELRQRSRSLVGKYSGCGGDTTTHRVPYARACESVPPRAALGTTRWHLRSRMSTRQYLRIYTLTSFMQRRARSERARRTE